MLTRLIRYHNKCTVPTNQINLGKEKKKHFEKNNLLLLKEKNSFLLLKEKEIEFNKILHNLAYAANLINL